MTFEKWWEKNRFSDFLTTEEVARIAWDAAIHVAVERFEHSLGESWTRQGAVDSILVLTTEAE